MSIHIINLIISIIFMLLASKQKKNKKIMFFYFTVYMTIIMGLRFDVGRDYMSYYENYQFLNVERYAVIFKWVSIIFKTINLEYSSFLIVYSFFSYYLLSKIIMDSSKYYVFAILIFFISGLYLSSLNLMRQFLATLILTYSIDKEKKKKIILFLLALGIHKLSIVFIVIYFIINKKYSKKFYRVTYIIALISLIIQGDYLIIIIDEIKNYLPRYYQALLLRKEFLMEREYGLGFLTHMIVGGIIIFNSKKSKNKQYFNLYFIYIITSLIFIKVEILTRLTLFFKVSAIVVIPEVLNNLRKPQKYILKYIIILFLFAIFYKSVFYSSEGMKYKYRTIFDYYIYN